ARRRGIDTEGKSGFDVMMALFGKLATGTDAGSTVTATAHCRMPWVRATGRNIYTNHNGTDPHQRKEVVVVQAFYDSMSVVPGVAPGADSTGGIAGLLELAKVLKQHPPKRSVLLLATGSHFVSWEGIADWMLRHGARGGTEVLEVKTGGVSTERVTWGLRIVSLLLAAGLVAVIVVSTSRMRHWHKLTGEDPQAERRASGMSSLRFVAAIFLVPVALIALLTNLEKPLESKTLEPMTLEHDARVKFYFSMDLSSNSPDVGLFFMSPGMFDKQWDWPGKSHRNYMRQYSKRLTDYADEQKIGETLDMRVIDCVEPKGREEGDYVPLAGYLLDGNVVLRTGNPCITFMTVEDCRPRVDTPLDNLEPGRVNTQNLTRQLVAVCSLVWRALDEPDYTRQATQQQLKDRVKEMHTRVVEANYRESFVADTPVVDALVVYRQGWSNFIAMSHMNLSGVRGLRVRMTDEKGMAHNPFLEADGPTRISGQSVRVRAYKPSADDGRIIYALDRGEQGAKSYPIDVTVSHPVFEHQVVAFQCEPIDFYHLDNVRYLRAVGAGRAEVPIIFDANDATPQEFGYDLQESVDIQTGQSTNCAVVYVKTAPPGTDPNRIKLLTGSVVFGLEYLATNTEGGGFETVDGETVPKYPEGVGYPGAPPYVVFNSALAAARDMIRIDRLRMERFEKYAVVKPYREGAEDNQRLPEITHRAEANLRSATAALGEYRYHDFRTHLDKALGFEARAYPDVKGTANDIVKGFMFYCVLLLPFAFFCERLFFGFTDIRKQLFGFAGFFLAIFAVMAFVHPVFRITDAPYVILLAFVILVLAMSVLFIIIAKFNEQMAKMRRKAAKVHEADV
ncbi:MAG TPA: M28 family peptidase, partial [Planctomycetota bacterium]|nr:M28 family peptidase [Planctomycetota bacterium]